MINDEKKQALSDELKFVVNPFDGGVRVTVRARPGTARARAAKIVDIGGEKKALEMAVSAPAEEGKANKAIEESLAKWVGVKKACVFIKAGQTGRIKIVEILGGEEDIVKELSNAIAAGDQDG